MSKAEKDTIVLEESCNSFQLGVLDILEEYDYEILDLRYMEHVDHLVITILGLVIFVTKTSISISFEVNSSPECVGNLILILSEHINPKLIHITDSFTITTDSNGKNIAIFGPDAKEISQNRDIEERLKYINILSSPYVKFYEC
jgi:hypothetical protein